MSASSLRPALAFVLLIAGCCADDPTPPGAAGVEVDASAPVAGARPGPAPLDVPVNGADLYRRDCASCHGLAGDGDSINSHYVRMDPEVRWPDFSEPGRLTGAGRERARRILLEGSAPAPSGVRWMPPWRSTLSDRQVEALLDHMASLTRRPKSPLANLSTVFGEGCAQCHHVEGPELVRQANCAGCHPIGGQERREIAPDLAGVGTKFQPMFLAFLLRFPWARRQPGFHPLEIARMPDFHLTDEEAWDLTEYLRTRTELDLPERYEPPELGREEILARGRSLVRSHGCVSCHKLDAEGGKVAPDLTWLATGSWSPQWVYNWILDPARYLPEGPMPDLELTREDARIVTAFLVLDRPVETAMARFGPEHGGRPDERRPYPSFDEAERRRRAAAGETLFRALGCRGCHPLGDEPFDPKGRVGPPLDTAGVRLTRDWAYDLLASRKDIRIRPGLAPARMPSFSLTKDEFLSILDHFEESATARWGRPPEVQDLGPSDPEAGRRVFVEKDCHDCHRVGDEEFPPVQSPYFVGSARAERERWAPDLGRNRTRLDRAWTRAWLRDPTRFDPDSRMPRIPLADDEIERLLDFLAPR